MNYVLLQDIYELKSTTGFMQANIYIICDHYKWLLIVDRVLKEA